MISLTKEQADAIRRDRKILTQEILDNCICIPHFNSRDCPIHGAEWKKGEEYPPIEIKKRLNGLNLESPPK